MDVSRGPAAASIDAPPIRPVPPAWVDALVTGAAQETLVDGTPELVSRAAPSFTLLSAQWRRPPVAKAESFASAVAQLYGAVASELRRQRRHPVRIWNFVPEIQAPIAGAGDRYMAFNMGRFAAYSAWFGGVGAFGRAVPTSSAVGITEDLLAVHVLASDESGQQVENPRQISSYRYSRRYGFRPPCFARATKLPPRLLIGGTASILGEDSRHGGDVARQTRETFRNLAALVSASRPAEARRPLAALRSLRVHVRDAADAGTVRVLVEALVPHVDDVELVQAPLCRRELLVEIEGVADC